MNAEELCLITNSVPAAAAIVSAEGRILAMNQLFLTAARGDARSWLQQPVTAIATEQLPAHVKWFYLQEEAVAPERSADTPSFPRQHNALMRFLLAPDGGVDYVSPMLSIYCGVPQSMIERLGLVQLLHPADALAGMSAWWDVLEHQRPGEILVRLRRSDGTWRRFLTQLLPLYGSHGRVRCYLGSFAEMEREDAPSTVAAPDNVLQDAAAPLLVGLMTENPVTGELRFSPELRRMPGWETAGRLEDVLEAGGFEEQVALPLLWRRLLQALRSGDRETALQCCRQPVVLRQPLSRGTLHYTVRLQTRRSRNGLLAMAMVLNADLLEQGAASASGNSTVAEQLAGQWLYDMRRRQFLVSAGALRTIGLRAEDYDGSYHQHILRIHPDDRPMFFAISRSGSDYLDVPHYRILHRDGTWKTLSTNNVILRDADGLPLAKCGTVANVEADLRRLRAHQEKLRLLLGSHGEIFEVLSAVDDAGEVMLRSAALERLSGWESPAGDPEQGLERIMHSGDRALFRESARAHHHSYKPWEVDFRVVGPAGEMRWLRRLRWYPELAGRRLAVSAIRDIHDEKEADMLDWFRTRHDVSTGLLKEPIWRMSMERLLREYRVGRGKGAAVITIYLSPFDQGGGTEQQQLLQQSESLLAVLDQLEAVMPPGYLCQPAADPRRLLLGLSLQAYGASAGRVVQNVVDALQRIRLHCNGWEWRIAAGAAWTQQPESALESLLQEALEQETQHNATGPGVISTQLDAAINAARIRKALHSGEITAWVQPICALGPEAQRMARAEILLRWWINGREFAAPTQFIPIAEREGVAPEVDFVALRFACQFLQKRRQQSTTQAERFPLSVNFSALTLAEPMTAHTILRLLEEHGVEAGELEVEVTETSLLPSGITTQRNLELLRERGIAIWLDDFGAGYSSLSSLARFPISGVKVDRSLLLAAGEDTRGQGILKAIASMCQQLALGFMIEGIENEAQLQMARNCGYEMGQGYLLGKPGPLGDMPAVAKG
jgi:EAL domain-containing protein (putative c-di-GMP-specific phosphodiesterase class I)/PAS domain-containing protein